MVALLLLGLGCFAVGAAVAVESAFAGRSQRRQAVKRAAAYAPDAAAAAAGRRLPGLDPLVARMASVAIRLTPRLTTAQVARRLTAAGLDRLTVDRFLAGKLGLALVGGGFVVASKGASSGGLLTGLIFGGAGFAFPDVVLVRAARRRAERIVAALPRALDQLAISMEAGLGFDASVSYYVDHADGPLAEELRRLLTEIRFGESRREALTALGQRVAAPEISALTQAVAQADQMGLSLAHILRTQAEDTRMRRQMRIEEKAMKAPVKMMIPTVIFILPVMFVVVLGPAVVRIGEFFSP
jgi:tight adherence protein C